jgi:hypothetical protein
VRALSDDASGSGPKHSARRKPPGSMRSIEAYPPEQFLTDLGVMLILLLTLALLFHLVVIPR